MIPSDRVRLSYDCAIGPVSPARAQFEHDASRRVTMVQPKVRKRNGVGGAWLARIKQLNNEEYSGQDPPMRRVRARVRWIEATKGRRTAPPSGHRYVTIGRFCEDGPGWPDGAWSVVVEFDTPPAPRSVESMATVSFLMPSAPHERLQPGRVFTLHEGRAPVAEVEVLGLLA